MAILESGDFVFPSKIDAQQLYVNSSKLVKVWPLIPIIQTNRILNKQ